MKEVGTNTILLLGIGVFLLSYLDPQVMLSVTSTTGGDNPSHFHAANYLAEVLLPAGRLAGWDMGHFAGYPLLQFYFPLPFLLMALLGKLIPLQIAFKIITVIGPLTLPLATFYAFRALRYEFPIPVVAASLTLPFLLQEGNSMWGGNLASTLAGEFCHALGLSLSVLYLGSFYRGLRQQRSSFGNGCLLAACSLAHTYAFFFALLASLGMLLERRVKAAGFQYLGKVLVVGFCLQAFWAIPLVATVGFTTAWVWIWEIGGVSEVLPTALLPVAVCAAAVSLLSLFGFRRLAGSRARGFLIMLAGNAALYFGAPALGLVDIRFVPAMQLLLCFLAADLLALGLRRMPLRATLAAALFAALVLWSAAHVGNAPTWVRWNYEGFEGKDAWPVFRDINDFLAGSYGDPRVAVEFSPSTNMFGSVRAFEAIPHFAGRQVLEGTLIHSAINAPFIYYMQSEISETGTAPIPGYPYPSFGLDRTLVHFRLFNVRDFIAVSSTVVDALAESPAFERVYERGSYEIFRRREPGQYVSVPKFWPVVFETDDWRSSFHRWFRRAELVEIPLIATDLVATPDENLFPLRADSLSELPRRPIEASCRIDETLDGQGIRFTTSCPGLPHLIRVSYFPNWRVSGADRIYPVSPAFMLVVPEGNQVRLHYGRTASDWLGIFLTGATLLLGVAGLVSGHSRRSRLRLAIQPLQTTADRLSALLERHQRLLVVALVVFALGLIGLGVSVRRDRGHPAALLENALARQQVGDFGASVELLSRLLELERDTYFGQSAQLYLGWCHLQLGEPQEAAQVLERLIVESPDSLLVPEAMYHLATAYVRAEATDRAVETFQELMARPDAGRWGAYSADRLDELGAKPATSPDGAH